MEHATTLMTHEPTEEQRLAYDTHTLHEMIRDNRVVLLERDNGRGEEENDGRFLVQ